jgi:hypothetical protein
LPIYPALLGPSLTRRQTFVLPRVPRSIENSRLATGTRGGGIPMKLPCSNRIAVATSTTAQTSSPPTSFAGFGFCSPCNDPERSSAGAQSRPTTIRYSQWYFRNRMLTLVLRTIWQTSLLLGPQIPRGTNFLRFRSRGLGELRHYCSKGNTETTGRNTRDAA